MLISEKMNAALNRQVITEFFAAHTYLSMACTLESMGLRVLAKWFEQHAQEERGHGMRIVKYIHDVGGKVTLDGIPKPPSEFDTVLSVIEAALAEELKVTADVNALARQADEEHDYATRSFVQWFVDEQVEEVAIVTEVLDLVKMAEGKHMLQVEARVAKMLETVGARERR